MQTGSSAEPLTDPHSQDRQVIRVYAALPIQGLCEIDAQDFETSMARQFERQVEKYPDRTAAVVGSQQLTYAALNRQANRVAQAILARRGSGAEPIALLLGHDTPAVASILGVLKAGKF